MVYPQVIQKWLLRLLLLAYETESIIINIMNKQRQFLHLIRHWWDRILASDPGLTRLNQGIKVISSVMTAVCIMLIIVHYFAKGQLTAAIFSGVIGMIGILVVNDETTKEKMVTTALLPISSALAITIGSYLSAFAHLSDIALIFIVFFAFYLQKFRFRYFSLCMISFMSIYFASLLHVKASQILWLYAAIAVGITCAFVYNFFIFKDRPHRILVRCLSSFHRQINLTFNIMMEVIEDVNTNRFRYKSLKRNVHKLNEYARMVAGELGSTDPSAIWPGIKTNQLRLYIFDAEMLMEALTPAIARLKILHALENEEIRKALYHVIRSLRDMEVLTSSGDHPVQLDDAKTAVHQLQVQLDQMNFHEKHSKDWLYLIRRIESIANHVISGVENLQNTRKDMLTSEKGTQGASETETDPDEVPENNGSEKNKGLEPSTKKAIQAVVAGGASIVLGYLLSPAHQYWILLSSFVVLLGTESVGRTMIKAFNRTAGTFAGAVAGFVIAHLIAGHPFIEIGLLFFSIFMAFYLFSISYGLMMFWITMMLSIMYDLLLGGITEKLLASRVTDTLIGAILGLAVSAFIMPKKTIDKVMETSLDFLKDLNDYLQKYMGRFLGEETPESLADKGLSLDNSLQMVRDEAQPYRNRPGTLGRSGIERQLVVLNAMNYYAKHLVASSNRELTESTGNQLKKTLKHIESTLKHNLTVLCKLLEGNGKDLVIRSLDQAREHIERIPDDENDSSSHSQKRFIHDFYYIWRINQTIINFAQDLGGKVEKSHDKETGT